jgi:hypothetical protein
MKDIHVVLMDWKELPEAAEEELAGVVEWMGGHVARLPSMEGGDTIGLIVSKKQKLTPKLIKKVDKEFLKEYELE